MKLAEILQRYESPLMRESVRTLHRKVIKESRAPAEGCYWWVPIPDGDDGVTWDVLPFYDKDYGGDNLHFERWPEALEMLCLKWHKDPDLVKAQLDTYYCALPRGRVGRVAGRMKSGTAEQELSNYAIMHGGDGGDLEAVVRAFNLRIVQAAKRLRVVVDEHERIEPRDQHRFKLVFRMPQVAAGVPA